MTLLNKCFPNQLISRFANISWPPRSPDLAPCHLFLWGNLKSRVYVTNPTSLQELKNNICSEMRELSPDTLMPGRHLLSFDSDSWDIYFETPGKYKYIDIYL